MCVRITSHGKLQATMHEQQRRRPTMNECSEKSCFVEPASDWSDAIRALPGVGDSHSDHVVECDAEWRQLASDAVPEPIRQSPEEEELEVSSPTPAERRRGRPTRGQQPLADAVRNKGKERSALVTGWESQSASVSLPLAKMSPQCPKWSSAAAGALQREHTRKRIQGNRTYKRT